MGVGGNGNSETSENTYRRLVVVLVRLAIPPSESTAVRCMVWYGMVEYPVQRPN